MFIKDEKLFYVYVLRRMDIPDPFDKNKGQPFYVGKGKNKRCNDHRLEAKRLRYRSLKTSYINKLWERGLDFETEIIYENLSKWESQNIEHDLIKKYGCLVSQTGVLTNIYNSKRCHPCFGWGKIEFKKIPNLFCLDWNELIPNYNP